MTVVVAVVAVMPVVVVGVGRAARLQDEVLTAGAAAGAERERLIDARATGIGFVPPTEAAALAVFLASNDADGLTGKLISAPHDPWREWAGRGRELSGSALYTLRRMDAFTVRPLCDKI